MTKKTLNQNAKYFHKLIDTIEPDFVFVNKSINRFKIVKNNNNNVIKIKVKDYQISKSKLIQLKIVI